MDRRGFLRGAAALLVGGIGAGCTGSNEEVPVTAAPAPIGGGDGDAPDSDLGGGGEDQTGGGAGETETPQRLFVPNYDFQEGDDGGLIVGLEIENRSSEAHSAVMRVQIPMGDGTYEPTRFVELDAGASETYRISVPVAFDRFMSVGGFSVEFDPGTPATPIPETSVGRPDTGTDATDAATTATDAVPAGADATATAASETVTAVDTTARTDTGTENATTTGDT